MCLFIFISASATPIHVIFTIYWWLELQYSRTSIIRPSIIRNLDYPAWQFFLLSLITRSENGRVPQMRMRIAAVTMETCLLIFCACADNHVALLFINKVGGSRRGLSIQLSGIFTYPACFWNQGVRIIEVLL